MHAIWSRASQANGSRRWRCLQATNVLIRRSGSAPSRRKIQMSDVFTAFYTTIMATAAVLDATYKDHRRKELDQRISEAKDGLAELMEKSATRDLAQAAEACFPVAYTPRARPRNTIEALNSTCLKPDVLLRETAKDDCRQYRRESLRRRLGLPKEKLWWSTPSRMMELEEFLEFEESQTEIPQREPVSSVQISRMSDMVNDLVDQLLLEAYREEGGDAALPSISLDSGWNAIRMLRSGGYPRYGDPLQDSESSMKSRRDLNAINRKIIEDWKTLCQQRPMSVVEYKRRREHFIAKICYNLLISTVPPGIHNYNALISGFSWIGEPGFAQAVVDSFLFKSHLRPTQMTLVSLLHHYRLKKDIVGFYSIIRRLTGHDPRGIGLRRRTREDIMMHRALWNWAQDSDVATVDEYVIERATIDRQLVEALLDGLIDFNQVWQAAKVYVSCMRDGLVIGSRYLSRIVGMCVSNLDRRAAETLVSGFLQNIDQVVSFILDDSLETYHTLPYNLIHLLDLYQAGLEERRASSLSSATYEYSNRLDRLKRAIQLRTALYELNLMEPCKRIVHSEGRTQINLTGIHSMVMSATRFRSRRDRDRRRFNMLLNLDWLSDQYTKHILRTRWVLFQALPPEQRRDLQSDDLEPGSVPTISIKRLVARWLQYLATREKHELVVTPETEETIQEQEQLGSPCYTRSHRRIRESPPAFVGIAEKFARSSSSMIAPA